MAVLDRRSWPADIKPHMPVRGIFTGGCVARGEGSRFHAKAHAHTRGDHKGWLCFLSARRLESREIVIHELAHLVSGQGHNDEWRATVLRLGGTLEAVPGLLKSYQKRRAAVRG